ncbi:MAG: N-acetylneuraminate synthase family protein [Bacteroidales bacterium]|nr:N-acetylneuraminate synthase family protein [Bacteroidales bacterium]
MRKVKIRNKMIGENHPVFIIAEIGINHNGSIDVAKKLIDVAVEAGCDAVKFQKRDPEVCTPEKQKNVMKETPWGNMTYLEYKKKIEFWENEYEKIDKYCKEKNIMWFASCWDEKSVDFIECFSPPCYKIPSALLTDDNILKKIKSKGRPIILSTGMSTLKEIEHAVYILGKENLIILHCTSTYPAKPEELNLKVIQTLKRKFECPIGYSGHEVGVAPSTIAATIGACTVERHITLDRAMWGSDHAASLEPKGLKILVRDIREIPNIMGNGIKKVYDSEIPIMEKLRKIK